MKVRQEVTIIGIGLIVFHALTEAHSIVKAIDREVAKTALDLFFCATYKMMLAFEWYLKNNFDCLLNVFTYFCFAWISLKYSRRLFIMLSVWFFYHTLDLYFFWYNYKTTYWVYWSLLIICAIQTVILMMPIKERAKVVSLE